MSNKIPIFPISEPQHFNDYGFDPQLDYLQVLEEANAHRKPSSSKSIVSVDTQPFRLQKPVSKSESSEKNKKLWWKNALHFLRRKWPSPPQNKDSNSDGVGRGGPCRGPAERGTMSGPVYVTESRSGSSTPYRTSSPIAGSLSPAENGGVQIPYVSLREINVDQYRKMSTSTMPIYLVT